MEITRLDRAATLAALPPEWPEPLLRAIQARLRASGRVLVVLDDDPTGTQTVHDVAVLTEWSVGSLATALGEDRPAFYVLTNSRSLPLAAARALNGEIGRHLVAAARRAGREFAVVSRSDSTLRGHFPGEVEALAEALGQPFDGWLVVPYFLEGGRYTIGDVHYVAEGDALVPAGATPFAADRVFGYRASNLREWVEEKTEGRVPATGVASISLADLRGGGPGRVAERLGQLRGGAVCVVNAASMRDVEVLVHGLLAAEARGQRFLYRTAASFVQVRAGLAPRPLLTAVDLGLPHTGAALIVVGSHVPRTTAQAEALRREPGVTSVEVRVEALLADPGRAAEIARVAAEAERGLGRGQDVMVYTSRGLVTGADAEHSPSIGQRVSDSLVEIVRAISTRPRYLVAKGGITSSDVATGALAIRRAMVRGQVLPGVPVWEAGPESRYPGLAYVVFPGNVGGAEALVAVVRALRPPVETRR